MGKPVHKSLRARWPFKLPCGCRLRNRNGAHIGTHAFTLADGVKICRHNKRWKLVAKAVEVVKPKN